MLGGYQIIDLTSLDMELSTSSNNILNEKVKKQFEFLFKYCDKKYNFSKPLIPQLKPVLIRIRDKKQNETNETVLWCNVSLVSSTSNYSNFLINAYYGVTKGYDNYLSSYNLSIYVNVTYSTDEYGNIVYKIQNLSYRYNKVISGTEFYVHDFTDSQGNEYSIITTVSSPIDFTSQNIVDELVELINTSPNTRIYIASVDENARVLFAKNDEDLLLEIIRSDTMEELTIDPSYLENAEDEVNPL